MTDPAELAKRLRQIDNDRYLELTQGQSETLTQAAAMLDQLASTMSAEEVMPFDAFHGGAKVFGAISEVVKYGGSVERALKAGEAALSDLRPSAPCP